MYSIYIKNAGGNKICIYNDAYILGERHYIEPALTSEEDSTPISTEYDGSLTVIEPVLTMEDSCAGSLELTIPPTNLGYTFINRMTTEIFVEKNGGEVWSGRVLSETTDFFNQRKLYCEGELAYLNDTVQPQAEYHDITVRGFLERLIQHHNSKADEDDRIDKHFAVGMVTVQDSNDSLYRFTNRETTMECINDKLLGRLGGHIRVRKGEDGKRYIDYLKDYPRTNTQVINFGENLLDFVRSFDLSNLATVLLPLGAPLNTDEGSVLQKYLTVKDVNHSEGDSTSGSTEEEQQHYMQSALTKEYVKNDDAIATFGWIEKVVHWDDVTDPSNLLEKAQQYLQDSQFEDMQLEISAVDLNCIDVTAQSIELLDEIRVVSAPHGLDRLFPVRKLSIPLDSPENAKFELGTTVRLNYAKVNNSFTTSMLNKLDSLQATSSSQLVEAQNNASQLIKNATNGYVTILTENNQTQEILISNEPDYTTADKIWRWNLNGLGYSSTGYNGSYGLAMTMDGSIVADRITTGTMYANRIKGGTLTMGGINNADGLILLKNGSGEIMCQLDNSGFITKSSSNNWISLSNGCLQGGYGNAVYGSIDATATVYNMDTGNNDHGFMVQTDTFCINSPVLATTHDPNEIFKTGTTGTLSILSDVQIGSDGLLHKTYTNYHVENGLITSTL